MTLLRGVMRWILAEALDHACVPSRLSPFFYLSLSLIHLSYSRQLFSAFDSVSAFCFHRSSISAFSIRVSCFQFYRSRVYYSTFSVPIPCRLHFQSFVYLLFHLVSLTRHPYNMSPIVTFLVSGLLPFVSASLHRLLSWGL